MTARINSQINIINGPTQVMVRMAFGRPSKKCGNFGICHMELMSIEKQISVDKDCCSSCPVFASLTNLPNQQIVLSVVRTLENQSYLDKYFATKHFLIEEDYEWPLSIRKRVGVTNRKIPKGIYQIIKNESSYMIMLQLE